MSKKASGVASIQQHDCEEKALTPNESFPLRMYVMLEETDVQGLSHVVSWQPHGRCFVVHRRHEFVQFIMPLYFRMSKFSSFQRQLNLYGFIRITTGVDREGYYHQDFLRSRKDLCKTIRRQEVKGTLVRKPAAPDTEPNFYIMEFMPPLPSATTSSKVDSRKLIPTEGMIIDQSSSSLAEIMLESSQPPPDQANLLSSIAAAASRSSANFNVPFDPQATSQSSMVPFAASLSAGLSDNNMHQQQQLMMASMPTSPQQDLQRLLAALTATTHRITPPVTFSNPSVFLPPSFQRDPSFMGSSPNNYSSLLPLSLPMNRGDPFGTGGPLGQLCPPPSMDNNNNAMDAIVAALLLRSAGNTPAQVAEPGNNNNINTYPDPQNHPPP